MRLRLWAAALSVLLGSFLLASPPASAGVARTAATKYSGTGDDLIKIRATKNRGIIKFTHDGESNFAVWALKPGGGKSDLLVNTVGSYSGTVVFNVYSWYKTAAFEIKADGDWTAEVLPVSYAPTWKAATVRLKGDRVLKLKAPTRGIHSMRYRHSGDGNFAVFAFPASGDPDLLVNKVGSVSGRVVLPVGTKFVSVKANGAWYAVRK